MGREVKAPTKLQRERWQQIAMLGCMICGGIPELHHLFTGAGGRKNHDAVIPLCWLHHRSPQAGIHGMGRKEFARKYGTEQELLHKLDLLLATSA